MKKIQVFNVPPILLINLKRFRGNNAKQNTRVDFPVRGFDMSDFVVSNDVHKPVYDLFAVSNHFGQLQAGHYTAITKNGDKWYQFNDHKIAPIDEKDIVGAAAYILFYQRRGIDFSSLDYKAIRNTFQSVESADEATNLYETGGT